MEKLCKKLWRNLCKPIELFNDHDKINAKGGDNMKREYSVLELSNYICCFTAEKNRPITNLHLQKILYYVQGYFLRKLGTPAFAEGIYNWPYGPVVPEAYFAYNTNLNNPITNIDQEQATEFDDRLKKDRKAYRLLHAVVDKCLGYTARQLVSMTHKEDPWKNTHQRQEIEQSEIDKFFIKNDPLELG